MNKQTIIARLTANYASFVSYINSLTAEQYSFTAGGKWNAEQQLQHMILCVKPLVQVFSMDKQAIGETFGQTEKQGRTYDALLSDYLVKLNEGGKAPERFVPTGADLPERGALCDTLTKFVSKLCYEIETFTEEELDGLLVPHPLLGSLTFREMLYNAIYHVQHHQSQIEEYLREMP